MFLKVQPLTISAPPPRSTAPGTKIDNFITKTTLQEVRHLRLNVHSHGSRNTLQDWKYLFSELADYLKVRHSLHTLHINVMDGEWVQDECRKESLWPSERVTWEGFVDEEEMSQLHAALAGEETTTTTTTTREECFVTKEMGVGAMFLFCPQSDRNNERNDRV